MKNKAVIVISGGLDSTVLLYYLHNRNKDLYPITFNYGQKHSREINFAKFHCKKLNLPHKVIDMKFFGKDLANNSALTGNIKMPHGHYASESMKKTVVPFRNGVMLALAVAYAENIGAKFVYYGAHPGDHQIYPDCTKDFERAFASAAMLGTFNGVDIQAPWNELNYNKEKIVQKGLELNVDMQKTQTCYAGKQLACGKCGSCNERLAAFKLNGIEDKVKYEK